MCDTPVFFFMFLYFLGRFGCSNSYSMKVDASKFWRSIFEMKTCELYHLVITFKFPPKNTSIHTHYPPPLLSSLPADGQRRKYRNATKMWLIPLLIIVPLLPTLQPIPKTCDKICQPSYISFLLYKHNLFSRYCERENVANFFFRYMKLSKPAH